MFINSVTLSHVRRQWRSTVFAAWTASLLAGSLAAEPVHLPPTVVMQPGQQSDLPVSLDDAAGAGGLLLTVSVNGASIVAVTPANIYIPAGATAPDQQPRITALLVGTATITVSAAGFQAVSTNVRVIPPPVGNSGITLPDDVVIRPGQQIRYPVSLSSPAGAGGISLTLVSSDPRIAGVVPPIVYIPAGESIPAEPPVLSGWRTGSITITASASGFQPASQRVLVATHVLSGRGTAAIDGVFSPGEWENAGKVDLPLNRPVEEGPGPAPATLYVMNDGTTLYLALKVARTALSRGSVSFSFDNKNPGVGGPGDDVILLNPEFGPFWDEVRTPDSLGVLDTDRGGTNDGSGAASNDGAYSYYEMSHPLNSGDPNDFSLGAGGSVGFVLFVRLCGTGKCIDTSWPGDVFGGPFAQIKIQ